MMVSVAELSKEIFHEVDKDQSGEIDFDEFQAAFESMVDSNGGLVLERLTISQGARPALQRI